MDRPLDVGAPVLAQTSAHGRAASGRWLGDAVAFDQAVPLVAPGQTVALYDEDDGDERGGLGRGGVGTGTLPRQ